MRFAPLLVLLACAAATRASFSETPGYRLQGARWVSLTGGSDEDKSDFAGALAERGIAVAHDLPGRVTPSTPYVINIDGVCGAGWVAPSIEANVYEERTHALVLAARITDAVDCPIGFYRALAAELDRLWASEVHQPPAATFAGPEETTYPRARADAGVSTGTVDPFAQ